MHSHESDFKCRFRIFDGFPNIDHQLLIPTSFSVVFTILHDEFGI